MREHASASSEQQTVIVAGREVAISNPGKVLFPEAGHTKLDLVRYYLAVADGALRGAGGRPNVLVRYPERHRRRVLLSEARARVAARRGSRSSRCSFPSGRTAEEVVPRDAAALAWMANLACLELHPHPVRADDLDHPDELRVDLDPVPGVDVAAGPRGRARRARDARRLRPRRLAEDLGLARHARQRAHRAALDLRRGAPRRARAGARGRAARAGARDEQVVEGRAPRRVPRLQPEREGPHGRQRVLGAADARRARVGAADLGRDRRLRARRLHAGDDAGALRGDRRSACRHRPARRARSTRCSSCRRATSARGWATRRGRRTTGSRPGEPARVQPSTPAHAEASADRDRRAPSRRRTRSPGSSAGRRAIPRRRRTSSRPTCWSTRCAAASAPGRASA